MPRQAQPSHSWPRPAQPIHAGPLHTKPRIEDTNPEQMPRVAP